MAYGQSNPFQYMGMPQTIPTTSQLDYKPFTFEKLSNMVGIAYNLSAIENINTVSLPRGGEQQIFFVNNDDKIYTRQFDNSIGIVGYRQGYVEKLQQELQEAQSQLHEIFETVTNEQATPEEKPNDIETLEQRIEKIESQMTSIFEKMEEQNGPKRNDKIMAAISEMA